MNKKLLIILFITLFAAFGCNVVSYWLVFKPTDTLYFKQDFDDKTSNTNLEFLLADSINISKSALRLIRKKADSTYCYWIDIDTLSIYDKNQKISARIKIIGEDGQIKRFLSGWFDIDSSNRYNLNNYSIIEKNTEMLLLQ